MAACTAAVWAAEATTKPQPKLDPKLASVPAVTNPELAQKFTRMRSPKETIESDRKSTRLNSSHANISYAVFCLKKKKKTSSQRRGKNTSIYNVRHAII